LDIEKAMSFARRRPRAWHVLVCCVVVVAEGAPAIAQPGPTPVTAAKVTQGEVAAGQTFVGTVLPKRTSTVGSAAAERVVEFPVNEGDRVKKGQLLAALRTRTLEIDKAAAEAELELRRQELAELENGSRPDEIAQARARMMAAKARMVYAKTRLDRTRRLFENSQAADDEMNEVISGYDEAEQLHLEAKAALALAVEGPRRERIAQARARVRAQEEEIRRLEDEIAKHKIVAPFDGYIVAEHTEVGQWLAKGAPVVDLVELDPVDVRVLVLEDYIRHLRVGASVRVEIGALPGHAFTGQVALIVPHADVRSRSFPVKVRLKNPKSGGGVLLKSGMFARVTLPVGQKTRALLVPKDALFLGGRGPTVYVVEPSSGDPGAATVRPVQVDLGVASGNLMQVIGSLEPGQQVVVRGNERLRPGQTVTVSGPAESAGPGRPEPASTAPAPAAK